MWFNNSKWTLKMCFLFFSVLFISIACLVWLTNTNTSSAHGFCLQNFWCIFKYIFYCLPYTFHIFLFTWSEERRNKCVNHATQGVHCFGSEAVQELTKVLKLKVPVRGSPGQRAKVLSECESPVKSQFGDMESKFGGMESKADITLCSLHFCKHLFRTLKFQVSHRICFR